MAISEKQFTTHDARRLCRCLLDGINDVVVIYDPGSLRIIDVNRSAVEIYGYAKKDLIGKELRRLTHESTDNTRGALQSRRAFERTDITKSGMT
jgi:PAS domain S-box-containing protein